MVSNTDGRGRYLLLYMTLRTLLSPCESESDGDGLDSMSKAQGSDLPPLGLANSQISEMVFRDLRVSKSPPSESDVDGFADQSHSIGSDLPTSSR